MQPRKMMGFTTPGDQRVPIAVRDWNGMKLALWRSKVAWEIAEREAAAILSGCAHLEGCAGAHDEAQPCLSERYEKERPQDEGEADEAYAQLAGVLVQKGCPDRELRMSALVILNAARMFASIDARRPSNEPYLAPSREYFSEIIRAAGIPMPAPISTSQELASSEHTPPQLVSPKV